MWMKKIQPRFLYQSIWGPPITEKVKKSATYFKIFILGSTTHLNWYRTKVRHCPGRDELEHRQSHPVLGCSRCVCAGAAEAEARPEVAALAVSAPPALPLPNCKGVMLL